MRGSISDFEFCEEYLARVSRTFAINIGVLKGNSYKGILLAYLLCRICDTIEDDPYFHKSFKQKKLCEYASIFPPSKDYKDALDRFLDDLTFREKNDSTDLVAEIHRVLNELLKLPLSLVIKISENVKEMALGMASFQEKEAQGGVVFIEDREELERYCYYVAGTVGLMITGVFSEEARPISGKVKERLLRHSVDFGLGLQITNIAKDFYGDRERGWCYVPFSFYADEGIDPLKDSFANAPDAFLRVHRRLILLAVEYLDRALKYILDIPRFCIRYRLFCLWPLFMAIESLAKLYKVAEHFEGKPVKISRADVKRIVRNTTILAMSDSALLRLYNKTRKVFEV